MRCPYCYDDTTQVKDSRPLEDSSAIRRRRLCHTCGSRFTTLERVQLREILVIKSSGNREAFDREKLVLSISIATRKRNISVEQIDTAVNGIVRQLEHNVSGEVMSSDIGKLALDALEQIDDIAFVRYASVYKKFEKIKDFTKFIDKK